MNKQAFMEEMLKEIKDLKDLTKEELPLIAKEYIRVNKIIHGIGVGLGGIATLAGLAILFVAVTHVPDDRWDDTKTCCYLLGGFLSAGGLTISLYNTVALLSILLQPRRTAIEAVTSLLKD